MGVGEASSSSRSKARARVRVSELEKGSRRSQKSRSPPFSYFELFASYSLLDIFALL